MADIKRNYTENYIYFVANKVIDSPNSSTITGLSSDIFKMEFCLELLNVSSMMQNSKLAPSRAGQAFYQFRQ
ncbi:hypothetical protein [Hydrocoleum sp. CS-953]|uniref:hypothetical protein n=1 Tax=Microcoleaceae TaxID=1892252 RepID=UPI000B9A7084|nr:hypothetical protein [Hydrocoleum sp. CS-953]OZH53878.1 hypothetical protein AFK68_14660 [Hydrocoleum sp. CS-953]